MLRKKVTWTHRLSHFYIQIYEFPIRLNHVTGPWWPQVEPTLPSHFHFCHLVMSQVFVSQCITPLKYSRVGVYALYLGSSQYILVLHLHGPTHHVCGVHCSPVCMSGPSCALASCSRCWCYITLYRYTLQYSKVV